MALPFRTDTRDSCVAVGCRHGCATRRFAVPTPYTHSKLDNTSVSLSRSGGTLRTLHTPLDPRALALCGRQSSLVEAVHSVAVAMAKRCATSGTHSFRECTTLNRDAYAREPCLRRSLRALRLKADAVAWSSLRCVMSSCAQHLYTHLHSLSHRHPAPAAGRRTTPRPSLRSVVKSALVVPDVGRLRTRIRLTPDA